MIKQISQDNFNREVLEQEGVVVVDFFASWCGPCKMLSPVLEDTAKEMQSVKIIKVDIDENGELAKKYQVQSVPTLKIFKDGVEVLTKVGFQPKIALMSIIEGVL